MRIHRIPHTSPPWGTVCVTAHIFIMFMPTNIQDCSAFSWHVKAAPSRDKYHSNRLEFMPGHFRLVPASHVLLCLVLACLVLAYVMFYCTLYCLVYLALFCSLFCSCMTYTAQDFSALSSSYKSFTALTIKAMSGSVVSSFALSSSSLGLTTLSCPAYSSVLSSCHCPIVPLQIMACFALTFRTISLSKTKTKNKEIHFPEQHSKHGL